MLTCTKCKCTKEPVEFKRRSGKLGKLCSKCLNTQLEANARWRTKNPEAHRMHAYTAYHGPSAAEMASILREQDGCAICHKQEKLHRDHDHVTGNHRGYLCMNCNTGLGKFKDDPKLLSAAIAYLVANS